MTNLFLIFFFQIHTSVAKEGPTSTSGSEENVDLHFVALALVDGHIHELDGRNDKPTKLDASDESSFLKNAAAVCKAYMERNPGHFSLTALVSSECMPQFLQYVLIFLVFFAHFKQPCSSVKFDFRSGHTTPTCISCVAAFTIPDFKQRVNSAPKRGARTSKLRMS